jgi:hypothetical protein
MNHKMDGGLVHDHSSGTYHPLSALASATQHICGGTNNQMYKGPDP